MQQRDSPCSYRDPPRQIKGLHVSSRGNHHRGSGEKKGRYVGEARRCGRSIRAAHGIEPGKSVEKEDFGVRLSVVSITLRRVVSLFVVGAVLLSDLVTITLLSLLPAWRGCGRSSFSIRPMHRTVLWSRASPSPLALTSWQSSPENATTKRGAKSPDFLNSRGAEPVVALLERSWSPAYYTASTLSPSKSISLPQQVCITHAPHPFAPPRPLCPSDSVAPLSSFAERGHAKPAQPFADPSSAFRVWRPRGPLLRLR